MDKGGGGWVSGWRRREVDQIRSEDRLLGFGWVGIHRLDWLCVDGRDGRSVGNESPALFVSCGVI
jgi:hypothetical protein